MTNGYLYILIYRKCKKAYSYKIPTLHLHYIWFTCILYNNNTILGIIEIHLIV